MSKINSINEYKAKFRRCILEYTNAAGAFDISEEGDENDTLNGADPMGGGDMGADPMSGGADMGADPMGDGADMGADPMGDGADMGADPMGGADMNAAPNADGAQGPEGFNPEGGDPNAGLEGMGSDINGENMQQSGDEVIDVDDLTKSQEAAEEKIDKMNDKFEKLMTAVNMLIKQNSEREAKEREAQMQMKAELEKRIPTPQQRMSMRSTKSSPYSMTPNEYMNNYAPENYSDADDNNGADDMQYQITKDDIDRFTDYNSIMKDLDVEHQGLKDILGF
jgi:hypothetical protein